MHCLSGQTKFRRIFNVFLQGAGILLCAALFVRAEILPVKIYTAADGLGSSFISHLMTDSRGFLWICTRDGLTRFDGSRFINYRVSGRNSPPGIEQMIESRTGIYWIATTGGLYRYDPRKPVANPPPNDRERPTLDAEFISESRGTFYEDSAGNLWLGNEGLYRIIEQDGKFSLQKIELNLPPNPNIQFNTYDFAEGRDKSLWIATTWGLIRRLADGRNVFYQIENARNNAPTSVLEDRAGRIWLACVAEFYIIQPETSEEIRVSDALLVRRLTDAIPNTTKSGFAFPETSGAVFKYADIEDFQGDGNAKFLYQTSDGHIWISVGFGAIEFDGQTFIPRTTEQGFIKGGGQIIEDVSGNLWVGWSTGMMRFNREGLVSYSTRDGMKNPAVLGIGETIDGAIYAADGDLNIVRFDGRRLQSIHPALPPNTRTIWMSKVVLQDSAGEWWILTNEKLYRFGAIENFAAFDRRKPIAEYDTDDGFTGSSMSHIFEDSQRDLWISNRGPNVGQSGLARWTRKDEKFYFFSEADGFPANKSVSAFAEDAAGNRWFGFYEGGLARFSGNRFALFSSAETRGVVSALHLDKRGRLWMTSSLNGLNLIEDANADELSFTSYTIENGLASNNVRSITEDDFGQIYVGTARGVDRVSPDTKQIKHYTTNDGLAGDFVSNALHASNGALWFGTPNGLSRLVPKPEIKTDAPPVWLSGLRIAGERQPVSELGTNQISNLELFPSQNNLQIDFFGIDFKASESLRYQYKLEGADRDWSEPTEQRTVNYANLSAGDYLFLVRAIGADGSASQNPAIVSFRISRPVWQRWWFLTLVAGIAGFLIYLLYRYRIAQIIKLERVRTRIATDLHDDIGSSLSQIAILSEVARQKIGDSDKNEPLDLIADTSREIVDSMSDIVWAINPDKDHFSDLIHRMRRFASDILDAKDIAYRFHFEETQRDAALGADIRREVYLIFKESINNLVKYADASEVEMTARIENDSLVVEVKDNGKGFDLKENSNENYEGFGGNGLINMRRRAESLGGNFEIESRKNLGTTTRIRIPIK